jgi:hypothetical protein
MLELITLCLGKDMEEVRALIHDWVTSFEKGTWNEEKPSMPFGLVFIAQVENMFSSASSPNRTRMIRRYDDSPTLYRTVRSPQGSPYLHLAPGTTCTYKLNGREDASPRCTNETQSVARAKRQSDCNKNSTTIS